MGIVGANSNRAVVAGNSLVGRCENPIVTDTLPASHKSALARKGVAGVKDIRGAGLMMGIELDRPCADVVKIGLAAGVLTNVTQDCVVRILPPLIINEAEAREIAIRISGAIKSFLAMPNQTIQAAA